MPMVPLAAMAARLDAASGCNDDRHPTLDPIGRKAWQSVELPICPSGFDHNGLALDVTRFFETLPNAARRTAYYLAIPR